MHAYLMHVDVRFPVKVARVKDSSRPNRNHQVKMTGNFKKFGANSGFKLGKMMRFKLVSKVVEVVDGEECQIPVFDVC